MRTKFVEATQGVQEGFNHGKFMVASFGVDEWCRSSRVDAAHGRTTSLLRRCGWTDHHLLVVDLQTGEGAIFEPRGSARADLDKHRVWVCPMFEPFLAWLYDFLREGDFEDLPSLVELPDAEPAMQGYRREGPSEPSS